MAFSLTFDNITSRNIKHIYSGLPKKMKLRQSSDNPALAQIKREQAEKGPKADELRTAEYNSDHRCYVPKAPAFRIVSNQEEKAIVDRLRKPTKAASWKADGTDGNTRLLENQSDANDKPTDEEMDIIVARLQKPTKMSTIRSVGMNGHSEVSQ